jgi:transposase
MAYRELGMVEVREILRRWLSGEGVRVIARGAGMDRKTIAAYVQAAVAVGVQRGRAPQTDAQIATIAALRRPGRLTNATVPSPEVEVLRPHELIVRQWLDEGLRLTKIYRRLRAQGVRVSYSSLYRFARAACDFGTPTITVRMADPPPGEVAETDFGALGHWPDPSTGRRRRVYGLPVTLCFSRYAFLAISLRQDLGAVLDGLEAAWAFFGGVVHRLVIDNLTLRSPARIATPRASTASSSSTPSTGASSSTPPSPPIRRANPVWSGGSPTPARTTSAGNASAMSPTCRPAPSPGAEIWPARACTAPRARCPASCSRRIEQPTLLSLAPAPFDRPTWAWATVHGDHHIKFRHALYSVPTRYLHQRVEVRADARLVRIYHRSELIKVHPLQPIGGRATDYTDYPAAVTPYALRDPDACARQAALVGPAVEQFVRVLLRGVFPWARLRQAQKLLRLADRYGAARVNAACARALGFDLIDVGRVEAILRAALEREPGGAERGAVVALPARPRALPITIPKRRTYMSPEITPDLLRRLKRLRLGGLVPTLPDRAAHARQAKLSPLEFLELLLQDEIDRRDSQGLTHRIEAAGFDEVVTYEDLVWETPVHYDRPRVRDLFRLDWLAAQENVIFCGPVGVGKSWFAEALGYSACRAGHRVRFIKLAKLLLALRQARADHTVERELRTWLAPRPVDRR